MNDDRKLAHIELINDIQPIEGSDFLEVCSCLGWHVVVRKDEFKVGDKVLYIEVDSVLPPTEEFEFMAKYKYRVKTIKLRGQVSQGLIVPLVGPTVNDKIGADMTAIYGIKKYLNSTEIAELQAEELKITLEKSRLKKFMYRYRWYRIFTSKKKTSGYPYWVVKTDEQRIQNIPKVLEKFEDSIVYVTEKVDYQSATFTGKMIPSQIPIIGKLLKKKFKFVVCSRNLITNDKDSLYWRIANKYHLEEILKSNPNLTIQGEQGSTNVQGNKYGINEPKLWVFNIIDHTQNYHYDYEEMRDFCNEYGLSCVPLIGYYKMSDIGSTVDDWVGFSQGKSLINTKIHREGVVVRSINKGVKKLSFKVINPNFLLKYDGE